jgi:hypothetical protein
MSGIAMVLWATSAAAIDVRLQIDSPETVAGAPITARVVIQDARNHQPPEFPAIPGVDISYAGRSSNTSISPGRSSSQITHSWSLVPKSPGTYVIPAITVQADGQRFQTAATKFIATHGETGDVLFVDLTAEREEIYLGEALDLTLEIWLRPFQRGRIRLDEQDMWNCLHQRHSSWGMFAEVLNNRQRRVQVEPRLRRDTQGEQRGYYRYTLTQRIWPDQPGPFNAGEIRMIVAYPEVVRRGMFGRMDVRRSRNVVGEIGETRIRVLPIPDSDRPAEFRGAVGSFDFAVTAKPTEVTVGDPITLTMSVRGEGRLELVQPPALESVTGLDNAFKIPADPIAGIVDGTTKTFTQSIRPRRADIAEIPAISFSFFDPRARRFATLHSDPIPITVKSAQVLAPSQIVGPAGTLSAQDTELTLAEGGIMANYTGIDAVLSEHTLTPGIGSTLAIALPPFLFAVGWGIRRRDHRLRNDTGYARRRQAARRARGALDAARREEVTADDIHVVLTQYVADRYNLPGGGLTRDAVAECLQDRQVPQRDIDAVAAVLTECEQAQYAQHAGDIDPLLERARQCINHLESHAQ